MCVKRLLTTGTVNSLELGVEIGKLVPQCGYLPEKHDIFLSSGHHDLNFWSESLGETYDCGESLKENVSTAGTMKICEVRDEIEIPRFFQCRL